MATRVASAVGVAAEVRHPRSTRVVTETRLDLLNQLEQRRPIGEAPA
jgi:hypothetical protein